MSILRQSVTFSIGQAVPWKSSYLGFAQIIELRRTKVVIGYRTKKGTWRCCTVAASDLCASQLLFEMNNPFNRGMLPKSKTFVIGSEL